MGNYILGFDLVGASFYNYVQQHPSTSPLPMANSSQIHTGEHEMLFDEEQQQQQQTSDDDQRLTDVDEEEAEDDDVMLLDEGANRQPQSVPVRKDRKAVVCIASQVLSR